MSNRDLLSDFQPWIVTDEDRQEGEIASARRAELADRLHAGAPVFDFYWKFVGTSEGVEERPHGTFVRVRTAEGFSFYRIHNFLGFDPVSGNVRLEVNVEPAARQALPTTETGAPLSLDR